MFYYNAFFFCFFPLLYHNVVEYEMLSRCLYFQVNDEMFINGFSFMKIVFLIFFQATPPIGESGVFLVVLFVN